eukprot:3543209-Rhodomonas_salina.2
MRGVSVFVKLEVQPYPTQATVRSQSQLGCQTVQRGRRLGPLSDSEARTLMPRTIISVSVHRRSGEPDPGLGSAVETEPECREADTLLIVARDVTESV